MPQFCEPGCCSTILQIFVVIPVNTSKNTPVPPSEIRSEWHPGLLQLLPDAVYVLTDQRISFANPAGLELLKAESLTQILGLRPEEFLIAQHHQTVRQLFEIGKNERIPGPQYFQCKALDGSRIDLEIYSRGFVLDNTPAILITARKQRSSPAAYPIMISSQYPSSRVHEALHHEKEILEMIALDKPLTDILEDVCDRMERLLDNGAMCAISLYQPEDGLLRLGAGPSLPESFTRALSVLPVGTMHGCSAEAVFYDRITIVQDISLSPSWENLKSVASSAGIRAAWSLPIRTAFSNVLGSVDVYYDYEHHPNDDEQSMITDASDLIGLAIDKKNMEQSLEESEERYRSVVTNLTEGIMVIGAKGQILTSNPSALKILKIDHPETSEKTQRYFRRLFTEDGTTVDSGNDPASRVFRNGEPILDLTLGVELQDNSVVWLQINCLPIIRKSGDTVSSVLVSFTDTTEMRATQQQLNYMASYDALTGLPNRHYLNQRLNKAISEAAQQQQKVALMFLDLDRFKNVNDTAGHAAGDALLREVAQRLRLCVSEQHLLARLGGDEFVIVVENLRDAAQVRAIGDQVLQQLHIPFVIDNKEYHLGTSIGISIYPHDGSDVSELMRCADSAMYHAKECGKNNYQFFTTELNVRAQHRYTIESSLRRALNEQEFEVYYQPKIAMHTGQIIGAEALIRWNMPGMGLTSPAEFIPIAEELGLILPIGRWVLEQACLQTMQWRLQTGSDLTISVNISPKQFADHALPGFIAATLERTGLPGTALQLEITEGLLMSDPEQLLPVFNALRALGVSISLDDFGTGFSSLSYLQRFPIDNLKIDRSFIHQIPGHQDSIALTQAIIAMASALKMRVTAEGVETEAQLRFLSETGCHDLQGYYFSPPVTAQEFSKLLARKPA